MSPSLFSPAVSIEPQKGNFDLLQTAAGTKGVRYDDAVVIDSDGESHTLRLWKQLWAFAYGLDTRSKRMVSAIGVSAEERLIIRFIAQNPTAVASSLATALGVHPRTVTRMLRQLERRRYVIYRSMSRARGRSVLALTPRGMRVDAERQGTFEAAVRRTLLRLGPREIAASAGFLELLAGELRRE